MTKTILFVITLFVAKTIFCQEFINVTSQQNIVDIQDFNLTNANGMSFYDFDEDGWDDITYPMNNDSIIFYKNFNGQFHKIGSFLYSDGDIRQILWVDYDNDGVLDLCISYNDFGVKLYKNMGNFNFIDVSISSGIYPSVNHPYGFSFADPDNDNDLDLYIADYSPVSASGSNMYFENQGDGTFIENSDALNLNNGSKPSFMGVWFDYNNDSLTDLHVINDRATANDALYKNTGGTFEEVAESVGIANAGQNPMTSSVSDYNNDGFQDVFITDFGIDSNIIGQGPFHYKLFENQDGIVFTDKAPDYGMSLNDFGWGALWVDYNNDLFEDLYVATGNFSSNIGDSTHSILYQNNGGLGFTKINDSLFQSDPKVSFCPVKGDINNDGFYDIAVLNMLTTPDILLNQGNSNNFIKITPVGIESNRMAIGAEIRVFTQEVQQLQTVFCGEQLFAQNSQHKIFGLGNYESVDSIHIHFPSGLVVKKYDLPANQSINIYEEINTTVFFQLIEGIDSLLLCQGDSLNIELNNYENYLWNTGSQDSSITISESGTYYFEALNSAGDTVYRSNDLTIEFENTPLFQLITEEASCEYEFSANATLLFADTTIIDSVYWSNGDAGLFADSLIEATNYSYTFLTNNLCLYSSEFSITNSPLLSIQYLTTAQTNETLGSISVFIFGGTPPFTFILDGDTIGAFIDSLNSGLYELLVIDSEGCSQQETILIQNMTTVHTNDHDIEISIKLQEGHIEICSPEQNLQRFYLYDLTGKKVFDIDLVKESLSPCKKFEFIEPSGFYIALIKSLNGDCRRKLYKP